MVEPSERKKRAQATKKRKAIKDPEPDLQRIAILSSLQKAKTPRSRKRKKKKKNLGGFRSYARFTKSKV